MSVLLDLVIPGSGPYELEFEPEAFAQGSFASVHRGVWGSGTHVVVKRFLVDDSTEVDVSVKLQIEAEMNLWHQFNHPNIIKMFGPHTSVHRRLLCARMQRMVISVLFLLVQRSIKNAIPAGLGLVHYMHKKRVVHGDLKLNNILVGADGQAKLSDFGLSSVSGSAAASEAAIAGGLRWRAPEYLTHAPTFASDVYSFAMCMIEAEIGNPPFAFLDDDGVRENLRDGTIPDKPDTMSSDEWDLVVSMTNVYPAKRISLLSVLEKLKRFAKQEATANPDGAPKQTFAATQSLTSAEVVQSSVVGASNRIAELLDKIAVALMMISNSPF
ncbi:Protein kinase-like domain [Phytophthora cactorum]|nr:Protein kinase-like domain [Phytophthora cactorum]